MLSRRVRFLAASLLVLVAALGCGQTSSSTLPGSSGGASAGGAGGTGGASGTASGPGAVGAAGSGGGTYQIQGGATPGTGGAPLAGLGGSTGGVSAGGMPSQGGSPTTSGGAPEGGSLWRGPTPADDTANFPFPQNRENPNCSYPTDYRNEDVVEAYAKWKSDLVTSNGAGGHLRVQRLPSDPGLEPYSTVSEGIGYGMIIAVYMNDQPLFDELWQYEQLWVDDATGLMNWYINAEGTALGTDPDGWGAATDADEDMAWALVMADRQWGGQGSLSRSYIDFARTLIASIFDNEIYDGKLPKNGSQWGDWDNLNISYFAPANYRVFADVSGNSAWSTDVVQTVYDTIDNNLKAENGNAENGLVPAWSTSEGAAVPDQPFSYQYDSCRTPFRIGLDACLFDEPRAITYLAKISSFFSEIGAANIVDGYQLDGTPSPEHPGQQSSSFVGPAGVGAMSSNSFRQLIDDAYTLIRSGNLMCGGVYYDESWMMLSLLMMTGNYLDYTKY